MIYLNNKGNVLIAIAADLKHKQYAALPQGIDQYIYPGCNLEHHAAIASANKGLMLLPSGIMLAASSGVSYTDLSEPINGTLITGRFLSPDLLSRISQNTNLDLTLFLPNKIHLQPLLNDVFETAIRNKEKQITRIANNDIGYGYLLLFDLNNQPIGMMQVKNQREIFKTGVETIHYYLGIYLLSGIAVVVVIWLLLRLLVLQRLEYLNKEIKTISEEQNYSKRINVTKNDELSSVAKQFNEMMATIQSSHKQLENQVKELSLSEERLENTNQQLKKEINERILAEEKVHLLHSKLILAARRAGMADIASGVLHNIGNILNSVETSVSMAREKTEKSKASSLGNALTLLKDNTQEVGLKEAKGKKIIEYLTLLSQAWTDENQYMLSEIENLTKNIGHIQNVVMMQQSLSSTMVITEEIELTDVIEDALVLNKIIYEHVKIEIIREYLLKEKVKVDRVKLLHILVNLIKNSIDSLLQSPNEPKILKIHTEKFDMDHFTIAIADNGMGILADNITKIFAYGFTTKKNGHGFGLHTSATFAQEMMGSLTVLSEGENSGAIFTITLPIEAANKRDFESEVDFTSEIE